MILELTEQEGNALIELINLAVKTKGLEVAFTGHYLFEKIKAAHKQDNAIQDKMPDNVVPIPESK